MDAGEQEEIDRADLFVQARTDVDAIKDQIGEELYEMLLRWLDRGDPEYLRAAQEKIDFLTAFHRFAWGQVSLPEEGSGEGLDEIV